MPEGALAEHRVVLGRDMEAEPERLVIVGDHVVPDRVDLGHRPGGLRREKRLRAAADAAPALGYPGGSL